MESVAIIDRGRGPELPGTRITVYNLLPYYQAGWHHSTIAMLYGISSAEVLAMINYIEEHKEEVLAVNSRIEARIAKGNSPEVEEKRIASRARFEAVRDDLRRKRLPESNGEGHPG